MNNNQDIPVRDAMDNAILMHRDAHFGGSFSAMIEYYRSNGKGANPEFEMEKMIELSKTEEKLKQNLAASLLGPTETERVAQARAAYEKLRELYEKDDLENKIPLLIADLILTEDLEAENEINAIVAKKQAIVPALIQVVRAKDYYDPLFPGYGQAPFLAAKSLGLIGDKRAIISLFESIGTGDFFQEDTSLQALHTIGEPAKQFLLQVLGNKPFDFDNERAAIALIPFKDDPEVAAACLSILMQPEARQEPALATYLALACEGLADTGEQKKFKELLNDPATPKAVKRDIETISRTFPAE